MQMILPFIHNMIKIVLFTFLFLAPVLSFAQLDHRMSQQEKDALPSYLNSVRISAPAGFTQPPASPVRTAAEWEEIDALMITWTGFQTILTGIVRAAQSEALVYIVCSDSNTVRNALISASVPLTNVRYVVAPFNSIWCRDYGQWNVYTNDIDSLLLIDWIYNRPRPKDDTVPSSIKRYTALPMYQTTATPYDLVHTGGNFMSDGFGTGFSSELILNENASKSEAEIDTIMKQFMGITRYIKMDVLTYDVIHHIDMHMKLLDEETLLVGEYPPGVADGPQIEANLQYILNNFNSVYGTPYKVIRIPMPPDAGGAYPSTNGDYRTYTNSVFVNKTIIVPTYAQQYDTTALRIYREAMPGYNVVGVNCNSIISSLGAIHCITKEVSASDPLLISHQALANTYQTTGSYTVNALIKHRSGINTATLYYRTDTLLPYQSVTMSAIANDNWSGAIPALPAGSRVYYYIEANANNGKTQVRPMSAPAGYWKFDVLLNTGFTGINNVEFTIYPNPASGFTTVRFTSDHPSALTAELYSASGKKVKDVFSGTIANKTQIEVDLHDIPPGVYFLKTGEGIFRKLIVN